MRQRRQRRQARSQPRSWQAGLVAAALAAGLICSVGCGGERVDHAAVGDRPAQPDTLAPGAGGADATGAVGADRAVAAEGAAVRANRPPSARFEVLPPSGYAGMTPFRFDASFSSDDFNMPGEMFKRWDYDGDGTWDTHYSRGSRSSYVFADSGVYTPRLLVRDSGGMVDSVRGAAVTVRRSCPAPDFALVDANPNSPSFGRTYQLSDYRGRRVVLWLAAPSS